MAAGAGTSKTCVVAGEFVQVAPVIALELPAEDGDGRRARLMNTARPAAAISAMAVSEKAATLTDPVRRRPGRGAVKNEPCAWRNQCAMVARMLVSPPDRWEEGAVSGVSEPFANPLPCAAREAAAARRSEADG